MNFEKSEFFNRELSKIFAQFLMRRDFIQPIFEIFRNSDWDFDRVIITKMQTTPLLLAPFLLKIPGYRPIDI